MHTAIILPLSREVSVSKKFMTITSSYKYKNEKLPFFPDSPFSNRLANAFIFSLLCSEVQGKMPGSSRKVNTDIIISEYSRGYSQINIPSSAPCVIILDITCDKEDSIFASDF